MTSKTIAAALLGSTACILGLPAAAQDAPAKLEDPSAANVQITGHVIEPKQLQPSADRLERLELPEGFSIDVFAENLTNPRMIAVAEDGTVYVTERAAGDVVMLRDADGDGVADEQQVVANRPQMHGVMIDGTTMYLATVHDVYRTEIREDGSIGELERIIDDLPDAGQHPNRTLAMGPDGKLYISVGSTCNACGEPNPENATILQAEPDGSGRKIFASGLRNTIGFGFEPETGALYGMDHGIDWLGDNEQDEELNRIEQGKKYGWPYIYADGKPNPQDEPPNGITMEEWAAQSTEPELLYTPHAAPMQMAFYQGEQFPQEYSGDAFVAMRGSWNRNPPSGYEIVRIDFEDGKPVAFEPFVTGFLMEEGDGWGHLGRLAGLAVAGDGALLISDDKNGVIYRISHSGEAEAAEADTDPATVASTAAGTAQPPQTPPHDPAELALAALEPQETLDVSSPAFENGAPIPAEFAAEGQNISPPLEWAEGPEGTQSYAILMEDPDVAENKPFVHWLAFNIPSDETALEEGVPADPKLAKPEGILQGANDRGSTGYFGPRPPEEDPAHEYHFQVMALDTQIDLPHGASRDEFLKAIEGHVLAAGTVTGTYER